MGRNFHPHLESLERRDCLSITTSLTDGGHSLVIQGTSEAETVRITQDDVANTLTIQTSVTRAGRPYGPVNTQVFSSSDITKVTLDLAGGDDTVIYQLRTGTNLTNPKDFWVMTGGGNDSVLVDLANGDLHSPTLSHIQATLNFYSITDHGADNVQIKVGEVDPNVHVIFNTSLGGDDDVYSYTQVGNVDWRANLAAWVDGGAGRDRLSSALLGDVDSQALVDMMFRGGIGNDVINADVCGTMNGLSYVRAWGDDGADAMNINCACSADSTGALCMQVYGNAGNDQINETMSPMAAAMMFDSLINGGTGTDLIVTS